MDPLSARMDEFHRDHGMSKFAFKQLLDLIVDKLEAKRFDNPTVLPPSVKLSTFLKFLRSNSFQRCVGANKTLQISQAAVCKTVNSVAKIIAELQSEYVKFPNKEESQVIAHELSKIADFPPFIIGIIDGTHVQIEKPTGKNPRPERFYNR